MRKVLLLLTTLLIWIAGSVPALADLTDYLSTSDNIVVVTATSYGRGTLAALSDGSYLKSTLCSTYDNEADDATYLVLYPTGSTASSSYLDGEDTYYIYSVNAGKMVGDTSGGLTDGEDDTSYPLGFVVGDLLGVSDGTAPTEDGYYAFYEGSSGDRLNLGGSYQVTIDWWGSKWYPYYDDLGNSFAIEAVEDELDTETIAATIEAILATIAANIEGEEEKEATLTLITSTDELSNSTVVTLQSARGVVYYDGDDVLASTSSLGDDDETQQFVLYTNDTIDGYYFYSVAANAFVGVDSISATPTVFTLNATGDSDYPWYLATDYDGTELWLNNNNAGSCVIDSWTDLDDGNMHRLILIAEDEEVEAAIEALLATSSEDEDEDTVDLTPLREALDAFYEVTDTCVLGDGLGLYNIPGYTTEEVEESIAMAEAYYALESGQTQELVDSIAELINAGTAALTINLPEAGTYLRIQSLNTGYYISSDASETYTDNAATVEDGTGDETIFYFDGTHLQSYATGLYAAVATGDVLGIAFTADSTDEATDFLFYQFIGSAAVGNRAGAYAIFYADSTYSLSVDGGNYAGALSVRSGGGLWLAYFLTEVTIEESGDDDTTVEVKDAEALEGKVIASIGEAVSDITAFDGGTWYIFESGGTDRAGYTFVRDDQYYNGGTGDVTAISGGVVASALFRVIPNDDGTYSLVDGLGNYLSVNADWDCVPAAEGDDYTTFVIGNPDADTDATVWYLQEATASTILDTNGPGATVVGWDTQVPTSTTGNSALRFYPVTLEEYEAVEMPTGYVITGENATELVDGSWYYINNCPNGSRTGWIYYYGSLMYRNAESAPDDSISVDEASAYLFRADDNGDGTWSLTGGSGYTMSYTSSGVINWDFWNYDYLYEGLFSAAWTIENIDAESDGAAFSALLDGTSYYLDTNGAGYQPTVWAGTPTVDGNECVYFVEVEFVESLDDEDDDEEATVPSLEGKVIASIGEAVTSTDAFDGETYYLFKIGGTGRTGYAYNYDGYYYNGGDGDVTAVGADAAATMLFKVVPNEDGTYSLVDGTGAYMALSGWTQPYAAAEGDDYTTFNIGNPDADTDASVWYLQEATTSIILDTNDPGTTMAGWGTEAPTETTGNNAMQFIPVTLEEDATLTVPEGEWIEIGDATEEIAEEQWYYLYQGPYCDGYTNYLSIYTDESYARSYYYSAESAPEAGSLSEDAADYLFRFSANEDGTFSIVSATGLAMSAYIGNWGWYLYQDPVASAWNIEQVDADSDATIFSAEVAATEGYYIDTYGTGRYACLWTDTPSTTNCNVFQFIPVTFTEADYSDLEIALAAVEAITGGVTIGSDLCEYALEGYDGDVDEAGEAIAEATEIVNGGSASASDVEALVELLTAIAESATGISLNMPEDGTFLRIKSSANWLSVQPYLSSSNSDYASANASTERAEFVTDGTGAGTIFYYVDGTLVNYETGYYLTSVGSGFAAYDGVTTATSVSFAECYTGETSAYNVVFAGSRYLYTQKTSGDELVYYTDAGNTPSLAGYNFELEYVETLPVTTNSLGYATLYTPVAVALADGATVYEVTVGDDDVLATTAVEAETIGAGSAVLIAGDASTTYSFTIVETESDAVTGDLTGAVATVESADDAYTLSTESADDVYADADYVILFVLNEGEIQGFTAYLSATDDDTVTGIDGATVAAEGEDAQIYDLQGRAVSKTVKGGIYIINGKKVYVK